MEARSLDIVEPGEVETPRGRVTAFAELREPLLAFRCSFDGCNNVQINEKQARVHANQVHQVKESPQCPQEGSYYKINVQTFFQKRGLAKYFEVQLSESTESSQGERKMTSKPENEDFTAFEEFWKQLNAPAETLPGTSHATEITPWMKRSGYWEHLVGLPMKEVRAAIAMPRAVSKIPGVI